ncbi:hypothetical protein [Streptomyces sp. NPDC005969]|uniref:hypothetical protein n=1 Tax=Streptomyces sp. NPDC005969 TaxID=3156722 RepID=UPI0034048A7D
MLGQHTSPSGEQLLPIPTQLVDDLNEDIAGLADALTACGVNVLRLATPGKDVDIRSPHWDARATSPLNVRDQTIILGNTIVETAPHVRARAFENDLLKPAFYRYYEAGANWLSMPRPALTRGSLDTGFFTRQGLDVARATDGETAGSIEGWAWRWPSTARSACGWATTSWSTSATTTLNLPCAGSGTTSAICGSTA